MINPYEEMMNIAADPAWRDEVIGTSSDMHVDRRVTADIYHACFNTPAGRAVLADLYNRYVNASRCVPGEPEGSGFFREGAAQVVFDIAATVEAFAQDGDELDG